MKIFKNRFSRSKAPEFSQEALKKRQQDIPNFKDVVGFGEGYKLNIVSTDDGEFDFAQEHKKPIPASIEYLFEKVVNPEKTVANESAQKSMNQEIPDLEGLLFEQALAAAATEEEATRKKIEDNKNLDLDKILRETREDEGFSKAPLAEEELIAELEKKHMDFYSILAKIQETHVASDFKSAYDIQDRISYLLNHKTLLYKTLVEHLLVYLDSIIEKLRKYHEDISEKQKKFNRYNKKVSELKQYKFNTDQSLRLIYEHQEKAQKELSSKSKGAKETE